MTPIITAATRYKREITSLLRERHRRHPGRHPQPGDGEPAGALPADHPGPAQPGGVRGLADAAARDRTAAPPTRSPAGPTPSPRPCRRSRRATARRGANGTLNPATPTEPRLHPPGGSRPSTARPRTCSTASSSSPSAAAPTTTGTPRPGLHPAGAGQLDRRGLRGHRLPARLPGRSLGRSGFRAWGALLARPGTLVSVPGDAQLARQRCVRFSTENRAGDAAVFGMAAGCPQEKGVVCVSASI